MKRLTLLVALILTAAVWAQDADEENAGEEEAVVAESEADTVEGLTEEELEEIDSTDSTDYTEEDEDVFKPTDAVSYQQSVNFPVDI